MAGLKRPDVGDVVSWSCHAEVAALEPDELDALFADHHADVICGTKEASFDLRQLVPQWYPRLNLGALLRGRLVELSLVFSIRADERSRTADLLITNQLLYQLSYVGESCKRGPIERIGTAWPLEWPHAPIDYNKYLKINDLNPKSWWNCLG